MSFAPSVQFSAMWPFLQLRCSKIGLTIDTKTSLILWPYISKTTAFSVKKKQNYYFIFTYVRGHNIIPHKCHYWVHASAAASFPL